MKYLMMLVISLGLVGCGSSDSGSSGGDPFENLDAVEKWVEFNNSRAGSYSKNNMSYNVKEDSRYVSQGGHIIAQQTEEEIEKLREEATDITGNSYCFTREAIFGVKSNVCIYIDNADSYFEEEEFLVNNPVFQGSVGINSVNSRLIFLLSPNYKRITAMNLKTSSTDEGDELGEKSIVGEWTFKTYTFNDKLISLKSTTLDTCTANECTEINLTGLTYQEVTNAATKIKANIWLGSQGEKAAEVVMSPDQKQLAIMICKDFDFAKIKSLTECSFIAGTRKE